MASKIKTLNYKGIEIEANPTPEGVNDIGDFGWAFAPKSTVDNLPIFLVVVKCNHKPYGEDQRDTLLQDGLKIVQYRLDEYDYEVGGYYCYWWSEHEGALKGDCLELTKGRVTFTNHPPSKA